MPDCVAHHPQPHIEWNALFSLRAPTSTVRCIIFWILFECYILQMIVFFCVFEIRLRVFAMFIWAEVNGCCFISSLLCIEIFSPFVLWIVYDSYFFASRAPVWAILLWMDPNWRSKKHAQFFRKIGGFSFYSACSEVVVQSICYIVRACKYVLKIRESVATKRFGKIELIQFGNKNYKLNSSVLVRVKKWIVNV